MKNKLFLQIIVLIGFSNFGFAQAISPSSITQGAVYIKDIKTGGVDGGTCTSGSWQVRDLNTTEGDTDLVTLSSNQFTLQPGVYTIDITAPVRGVDSHKVRLYDVTNSSVAIFGNSSTANSASAEDGTALLNGFLTVTAATTFQLEHACGTTKSTNGFGAATSLGSFELYTQIKILRLR